MSMKPDQLQLRTAMLFKNRSAHFHRTVAHEYIPEAGSSVNVVVRNSNSVTALA